MAPRQVPNSAYGLSCSVMERQIVSSRPQRYFWHSLLEHGLQVLRWLPKQTRSGSESTSTSASLATSLMAASPCRRPRPGSSTGHTWMLAGSIIAHLSHRSHRLFGQVRDTEPEAKMAPPPINVPDLIHVTWRMSCEAEFHS